MWLEVFDVEHGQCSLITTDEGGRILIDCGHNSSTGWRPSNHLAGLGIQHLEELVITNFDEDHASDLRNLREKVTIGILNKNPTVPPEALRQLKSVQGMGIGIKSLCEMMQGYTQSVTARPLTRTVSARTFWNSYPHDFTDENNLSLIYIVNLGLITFCFSGDMTRAGWLSLLRQQRFVEALPTIDVFVASHHGRADGCCQELYDAGLNPALTVISDSGHQHASQDTVAWYRQRTEGVTIRNERRSVLTTRCDGAITFEVTPTTWWVGTERQSSPQVMLV